MRTTDIVEIVNDKYPDIYNTILAELIISRYLLITEDDIILEDSYLLLSFDFKNLLQEHTKIRFSDMNEPFHWTYQEFVPIIVEKLNRNLKGVLEIANNDPVVEHTITFDYISSAGSSTIHLIAIKKENQNEES
jgi:hypothetical protein